MYAGIHKVLPVLAPDLNVRVIHCIGLACVLNFLTFRKPAVEFV